MNQRPLFDLSRIPSKPAAPDDAPPDMKYNHLSAAQHEAMLDLYYEQQFCQRGATFKAVQKWNSQAITFADWQELYLREFIRKDEGDIFYIAAAGIEYLHERDLTL